ncbi:MAG: PIG-L family deacetylase, partial [Acetobacteraceae bacterium]|nr:PIG-L family deacetylase [Acetobacteraceae bacterium]
MLPLSFGRATNQPITILCIGAHSDDIEIGAGGAILSLLDQRPGSRVVWVVCSATAQRADEARRGADIFLKGAGSADVRLHNFRDGFF